MREDLRSQPGRQRRPSGPRRAVAIGVAFAALAGACGSTADEATSVEEVQRGVSEDPTASSVPSTDGAVSTTELSATEAPTTSEGSLAEQLPPPTVDTLAAEPSAGCGAPPPTIERSVLSVAGVDRDYELFLPSTYDNEGPRPLVLNIHGVNDSASGQRTYSDFDAKADAEGLVVLYPESAGRSWDLNTDADVIFVTTLLDQIVKTVCIDLNRIYAAGMSQGGDFSTLLACRLGDRLAAVASVAVLHHHTDPLCSDPLPAPVLSILGSADTVYLITSGLTIAVKDIDPPGPLVDEVAGWVETNKCLGDPSELSLGSFGVRREYGCSAEVPLVVYIHSGGHEWPGSPRLDVNHLIWRFFQAHAGPIAALS